MRCLYVPFGERYILIKDGREGEGEKWDLSLLISSSANRKDVATSILSIFDDYECYISGALYAILFIIQLQPITKFTDLTSRMQHRK